MITKAQIRQYIGLKETKKSYYTDLLIMFLIVVASILYIVETYSFSETVLNILRGIDTAIMVLFTLEFIARFWIAKEKKNFVKSIYSWIDFLTILPFLLGVGHFQFFRALRFFRLLRYSKKYLKFQRRKNSVEILFVARVVFTILVILYVSAAALYEVEKDVNPGIANYDDAFYFTLITVTTVGYGDIFPMTEAGRVVTALVILSGLIFIPYHIGSLMKFLSQHHKKANVVCQYCGLRYHDYSASHCKSCGHVLFHEHEEPD